MDAVSGNLQRGLRGRRRPGAVRPMSAVELVSMSASELVAYLRGVGVERAANGDRLHCDAPTGVITPELRSRLMERKQEILALLRDGAGTVQAGAQPLRLQ